MKVLIVSAHTDDAETAAGGTIVRLLEETHDVHHLVFSICEDAVPEGTSRNAFYSECLKAAKVLGLQTTILKFPVRQFPEYRQQILQELVEVNKRFKPDVVFAPSASDIHQDHATVSAEVIRAFRRSASIYGYDLPSSEGPRAPRLSMFYELHERHIRKKVAAIRCYKSVGRIFGEEYVRALAIERGARIGVRYAEAFEIILETRRIK